MYWFYDSTYILIIIGAIITALASAYVNSAFSKYAKLHTLRRMTGAQAAERVLHSKGIYDVQIVRINGHLNDHYNPQTKKLCLSDSVYGSDSVAAVCVAAHESGHAIQHSENYKPLVFRGAIVPVVNFSSRLSWPLILIGLLLSGNTSDILLTAGVILFCAVIVFQLITLPVEFDASARAIRILDDQGMLQGSELNAGKKVLRAAALTYVASLAASLLQLLRILILIGGRRRDN